MINRPFGRSISTVESAILDASEVPESERGPYVGRAEGSKLVRVNARSSPGRAHLRNDAAEWWGNLPTLWSRCSSLRDNGSDLKQQVQCQQLLSEVCLEALDSDSSELGALHPDVQELLQLLANVDLLPDSDWPDRRQQAQMFYGRAPCKAMSDSRSGFVKICP